MITFGISIIGKARASGSTYQMFEELIKQSMSSTGKHNVILVTVDQASMIQRFTIYLKHKGITFYYGPDECIKFNQTTVCITPIRLIKAVRQSRDTNEYWDHAAIEIVLSQLGTVHYSI